jgi:hypothetical protein
VANTYGNSGNRWWVGLNVGSAQSTIFGTSSILSPNGYESLPSGNAADDAKFAAAAVRDKGATSPVTISVENVKWFNINGPYATQALANAAIPAIQKAHPAPGEVQQVTAGGSSNAANGGGINPGSWENFLGALSSQNTWLRVAKVAIGAGILFVGIAKLTGMDQKVGSFAETAVKAAPLL